MRDLLRAGGGAAPHPAAGRIRTAAAVVALVLLALALVDLGRPVRLGLPLMDPGFRPGAVLTPSASPAVPSRPTSRPEPATTAAAGPSPAGSVAPGATTSAGSVATSLPRVTTARPGGAGSTPPPARPGAPCSDVGAVVRTSTGVVLTCLVRGNGSGRWRRG